MRWGRLERFDRRIGRLRVLALGAPSRPKKGDHLLTGLTDFDDVAVRVAHVAARFPGSASQEIPLQEQVRQASPCGLLEMKQTSGFIRRRPPVPSKGAPLGSGSDRRGKIVVVEPSGAARDELTIELHWAETDRTGDARSNAWPPFLGGGEQARLTDRRNDVR